MAIFFDSTLVDQIIKGRCPHLASLLGLQKIGAGQMQVNVFQPGALAVDVLSANGKKTLCSLTSIHPEGLFSGEFLSKRKVAYRLKIIYETHTAIVDDVYRFLPRLDSADLQLFSQGRAQHIWQMLGARLCNYSDTEGVHFVVWAPTAQRVSVLLESNNWDGRVHVMRPHLTHGLWELFVPDLGEGACYKFECVYLAQQKSVWSFEPFARAISLQPTHSAKVTKPLQFEWRDQAWQFHQLNQNPQSLPLIFRNLNITAEILKAGIDWVLLTRTVLPAFRKQGCTHVVLNGLHPQIQKSQQLQTAFLACQPGLGVDAGLQTFIDQAHSLDLAVVWNLALNSVVKACVFFAKEEQWDQHAGALKTIVLGIIDYWVQHWHLDGVKVCGVDEFLWQFSSSSRPSQGRSTNKQLSMLAREWLAELLRTLRNHYPALLIIVETTLELDELTTPTSKEGMGGDYRLLPQAVNFLPSNVEDLQLWLYNKLQHSIDGNFLHWLHVIRPVPKLSDELFQLLVCAQWSLSGRKWLEIGWQFDEESNCYSELGLDSNLNEHFGLSAACLALIQKLNLFYLKTPALYELDDSHEGIHVIKANDGLFAFERLSRHQDDGVLVLINTNSTTETIELKEMKSRGNLNLQIVIGQHGAVLPEKLKSNTRKEQETSLIAMPAFTAAIYSI